MPKHPKEYLEETIAKHFTEQDGQIPTKQELSDSRNALMSFFELLIEADKDLMKTHEPRDHGNTNNSD